MVQRIAFLLQLKEGTISEYEEAHRSVWPELLREMALFGITEYSIFRRGRQLFLYMRVQDFEEVQRLLSGSEVNRRWQQKMAPLFDPVPDMVPGELFATMQEVFYLPGSTTIVEQLVDGGLSER